MEGAGCGRMRRGTRARIMSSCPGTIAPSTYMTISSEELHRQPSVHHFLSLLDLQLFTRKYAVLRLRAQKCARAA